MTMTALRHTCACLALATALTGTPAFAQEVVADPVTAEDEPEIVVTGTLIAGSAEDSALPVDAISEQELINQGAPTALDLIKNLPGSSGVLGDSNQFDSRAQGADGVATVNLRGLGPSRTLVLLNGKRLAAAPIGVPSVDVNLLPTAAINRVEVLKDGAAATYGSDAIGGVVNFITNKNLEGLILTGDYRFIDDSDGDWTASATFGHKGDGLRFLASFGYQHRSPLAVIDRDFAARPYSENPAGGWTQGGNPSAFLPFFFGAGAGLRGGFQVDRGCAALGGTPLKNSVETTLALADRCANQFTIFDLLIEREDRFQAYLETEVDLTDTMGLEVTALYGSTKVNANTSPTYVLLGQPSSLANPIGTQFFVPPNNPGLIAYRAANPDQFPLGANSAIFAAGAYRAALLGGDPRFQDVNGLDGAEPVDRDGESIRFTASLNGEFSGAIKWELNGLYHFYERDTNQYDTLIDRLQLALRGLGGEDCNPLTGTPGVGNCQFFNPFSNGLARNPITGIANPGYNPAVANSPAIYDFIIKPSRSVTTNQLWVGEAIISGNTGLAIAGGSEIAFAVGAQYRKTSFDSRYGPYNNLTTYPCVSSLDFGTTTCANRNGLLGFLGSSSNDSNEQDTKAVFAELQIPIGDRIDIQLAARYEDYGGGVGSTFDPKASARFQVTDWLALRGSYQTTFRAPPSTILTAGDYLTSLQFVGGSFRAVRVNDNPGLIPESATSYGGGVLVDFGGFSASVDYWRYELKDDIVAEPLSGLLNAVFGGSSGSNTAPATKADCTNPLSGRFIFSGGPGGGGCGSQAPTLGDVNVINTNYTNGAGLSTSGLDFIANYRGDFGAEGSFGLGATASYVLDYTTKDFFIGDKLIQPGFSAVGKLNYQTTAYPLPEWKVTSYAELGWGRHNARLTLNYVKDYIDQRQAPTSTGYTVPSFTTLDFTARVGLPWDTDLLLSVYNLTNEKPGFARLDYNYDPFTANPLLRNFKVGLRKQF
ncbi:MAG: TonB-dependent receptor domain-containing protein [Cypionkella sp.]